MKKILLLAGIGVLMAVPASADIAASVAWCATNPGPPSSLADQLKIMPDGKPRGARTPIDLTASARAAKAAGNCGEAVDWLIACQDHNEGPQNELRADPTAACNLL